MNVLGANINRGNKPSINQQVPLGDTKTTCYQNTSLVRKHVSDHTSTISDSSLGDGVVSPLSSSYPFALETLAVIQLAVSEVPLTSLVHAAPNDPECIRRLAQKYSNASYARDYYDDS